ncbi:MAG: metal-dependent hydrolase [Chitinispirillaceae bacterium]|nr:metal-dependent hydrolase [Chitinispirillaceae bacterium]
MLIAHAPAGYLLTRLLSRTLFKNSVLPQRQNRLYRHMIVAGVLGSIIPDFDFIYHIFIDSADTSHHSYLTHMPVFWLGIWIVLSGIGLIRKNRHLIMIATVFSINALAHLALDTITGEIHWFYPVSAIGINLFKVADVHIWWVHNFMYHWTFLIEILIVASAMIVFLRVRETVSDVVHLFLNHKKLRALALRLAVCSVGIAAIILIGSMKFSIDNRAAEKVMQLKQYIVSMFES